MIGYKDRTYCGSDVKVHTCGRDFTEQDAIDAEEWWGGKDYPVAYMNFCDETDNTQPDHIVDMHEMVTDTNQASELFELCKEVYEATEWYIPNTEGFMNKHGLMGQPWVAPLYTSDYLLEKLPREIRNQTIEVVAYGDHWEAAYSEARDALWDTAIKSHAADTPLKALLKLTIALSEAGELK